MIRIKLKRGDKDKVLYADLSDGELFLAQDTRELFFGNGVGGVFSVIGTPVSGNTLDRPVSPSIGFMYFDTDLNRPVWYTGTDWVDADGNNPSAE